MQHQQAIIDEPKSHLTPAEVLKLARDRGARPYETGNAILIYRGSFRRDFSATTDGLYRADAIRSWLGV